MGMGFPLLKVPGISQKKTWEIWYWNAIGASKCRFYFIRSLCPWPVWCIITATAWNLDVFSWTIHGCKWSGRKSISKIVKLKTNFPTKKSPIGEQKLMKWWINNCDFGFWTFCWGPPKNGGCFSDPQSPATFLFNRFLWPHSGQWCSENPSPLQEMGMFEIWCDGQYHLKASWLQRIHWLDFLSSSEL